MENNTRHKLWIIIALVIILLAAGILIFYAPEKTLAGKAGTQSTCTPACVSPQQCVDGKCTAVLNDIKTILQRSDQELTSTQKTIQIAKKLRDYFNND